MTKQQLIKRAKNKFPTSTIKLSEEIWCYAHEKEPNAPEHILYISERPEPHIRAATIPALAVAAGLAPTHVPCPR